MGKQKKKESIQKSRVQKNFSDLHNRRVMIVEHKSIKQPVKYEVESHKGSASHTVTLIAAGRRPLVGIPRIR